MDIRKQIIDQLDRPIQAELGLYKQLKNCLIWKDGSEWDLDLWFKGVIESLYYRPNKYVLVLKGKEAIGKSTFFRQLLPHYEDTNTNFFDDFWYCEYNELSSDHLYGSLILNTEFTKKLLNKSMEDNFIVRGDKSFRDVVDVDASCNKRLASYCSTTNHWQHPPRNNFIVLHLESINHELFNNIDKLQLWIEIFNKFKPEGK